ncbi:hypothetical protein C8R43DRAFT_962734 [Mycena crocata]|nr:hypothetical protein C8R43DRAFT_962734 [Mycena crocata]
MALKRIPCTWMRDHIVRAVDRLEAEFQHYKELDMESSLSSILLNGVILSGCADIIARSSKQTTIVEAKLTAALSVEDKIQAAIYGFLWAKKRDAPTLPRTILFNVRDGEKLEISGSTKDVEDMLIGILREKYLPRMPTSDDQFQRSCRTIRSEVIDTFLDAYN